MNKTFKTLWNDVRRCYIVANEAQKTHGKPSKAAVVAVAVAAAMGATVASAAYVDPGVVAQNSSQVEHAKKTWETSEYNGDWGLKAINASTAYALGYHGQGVTIGVVDSGIAMSHQEFQGDRWHTVTATGQYSSTDTRYPNNNGPTDSVNDKFTEGQDFSIDGAWIDGVNDQHGTHVSGTIGANRDNVGMHGVAWGADMYIGNTGGTDSMTYGPNQDYGYFKAVYQALADQGVQIINQSWGSNRNYQRPGGIDWDILMRDLSDVEQAWYDFDQYGHKTFVDAAVETALANDVIFVWTNGNGYNSTPYTRAALPYFQPEAESHWVAVAASTSSGSLASFSGKAGYAKWWTITAPGKDINSAKVDDKNHGSVTDSDGDPLYTEKSGTSMAAPYVSGALGVIMSRYSYMTGTQARDTMFTTATTGQGGIVLTDVPNTDTGWGYVNLDTAMYGPGQFLGKFDVDVNVALDVWSNDISNAALDARKLEDETEANEWATRKAELDAKKAAGEELTADELSEYKYKSAREEARSQRVYEGSLVKRGAGTLVMTGNNTYRGGTTVEEGTLLGFNGSFGVTKDEETGSLTNGKVVVNGGVFGIIDKYDDQFTMKGEIKDSSTDHSVDITVNEGGTYGVVAGQNVEVGSLTFADGAGITVVSLGGNVLAEALKNDAGVTGSVTADHLEGVTDTNPVVDPDYAFFDTTIDVTKEGEGGRIDATLSRNDATGATYAATSGQAAMGNALLANQDGQVFAEMAGATKGQVRNTLASLSNDFHLAAQNATIVNTALMGRMIKDQANAYGEAQRAELENGATLWAAGIGSWGDVDAGGASVNMDVDYYAGFIGAELPYGNGNKVGVFFGYGQTDFDAGNDGDMDSDDIHIGMYGENDWEKFGLTYGFAYTTQDREGKQSLNFLDQVTHNAIDYNATVFQIFGEASYKGFNTESYQVEPYIGLSWLNVSADDFTQRAGNHSVKTEIDDQNLGLANIGVRGALPFTAGSVAMKVRADVGYMQFFGDKEATAKVTVGDAGTASITGEELSGMGMVGIGLDAAIGKNATFGVNYTGAFGSDITSHGIGAKLGIKF